MRDLSFLRHAGWTLWDPIGLNADPYSPSDEYDEYLFSVAAKLSGGISVGDCVLYLIAVERNFMGLSRADAVERATSTVRAISEHLETRKDREASIYGQVPGGPELLEWFCTVPSFHDAEVLNLDLRRKGNSLLRIHGWITTGEIAPDRTAVLDKHAVVTFAISGVLDVQLESFSIQNVIGGLILRRAPNRADRRDHLALTPLPDDIEIELEPCYGLYGLIRARSVSLSVKPGEPDSNDS